MRFAYPLSALISDYMRGGIGTLLTLPLILFVPMHPIMFWIFLCLSLIFMAYTARTGFRQLTWFELEGPDLTRHGPRQAHLSLETLTEFKLRYFSTRRDRENGWMQLTLKAQGASIVIESTLDGFDQLVEVASHHAAQSAVDVDDTSLSNLNAMGISLRRTQHKDEAADDIVSEKDWISELKAARDQRQQNRAAQDAQNGEA